MQTAKSEQLRYQIHCPQMPLAVYREVAAALRQVEGVQTGLNPMSSQNKDSQVIGFDYTRSQVGSLWLQYPENTAVAHRQQVDQILRYYGDRYGAWQEVGR